MKKNKIGVNMNIKEWLLIVNVTEVRKHESSISFWQMCLIYSSKYDKGYINQLR